MPKKLEYTYVKKSFINEGWQLLTLYYENCTQDLECVCPKGHKYITKWDYWKAGIRCPYCSGHRHDILYIKKSFEKEGYVLLTKEYKNARQKLKYICPNGHKHFITWGNWILGHKCPYCNGGKKHNFDFVKNSFSMEQYEILSTIYMNAHSKLKYKCPVGHIGYITWANWSLGHRCRECFKGNMCGDGNPSWKGGVTPFFRELRNFIRTVGWSKKVFEKYGYICQRCFNLGGSLHAHHVIPVSFLLEFYNITTIEKAKNCHLLFDVSNGLALCEACHKWVHSTQNIDKIFIRGKI